MRLLAAAVVALAVCGAAQAKLHWTPDKPFARILARTVTASGGLTVQSDVCMKPVLPKRTGVTVGVAQEDCLVVARGWCGEVLWFNGNLSPQKLPCAQVRKAMRTDAPAGAVIRYPAAPAA